MTERFVKALFLTLVVSLVLLAACGDDDDDGTSQPSDVTVRLVAVTPVANEYEVHNFGDASVDISGYRLCSKFSYTSNLSSLTRSVTHLFGFVGLVYFGLIQT